MKRAILYLSIVCAVACGDAGTSVAPGLYHLPDRPDAFSLEIQSQGTFRWYVSGCDSFGGDEGVWRKSDEGMVLLPRADEDTFLWLVGPRIQDVDRLDVFFDPAEDALLVTGLGDNAPEPQRWIAGGLCPICGGSSLQLGPTALELCDDPFPP